MVVDVSAVWRESPPQSRACYADPLNRVWGVRRIGLNIVGIKKET